MSNNSKTLITYQHEEDKEYAERLKPLLRGETVALAIKKGIRKKRRVDYPFIILIPAETLIEGVVIHTNVIVAIPGYGCEVIDVNRMALTPFIRAGCSSNIARVLVDQLKLLYEGRVNGEKT